MEKKIWESHGGKVQVRIETDSLSGTHLCYGDKNSNASYGVSLEHAEAIYNAVAYFKNSGEWPN
jgi:diaminopimelate decarboxylase